MSKEQAECRGCKRKLIGKPYYRGGIARHPETRGQCAINFYGGYVCSDRCDKLATKEMECSIDNHNDPLGVYRWKAGG